MAELQEKYVSVGMFELDNWQTTTKTLSLQAAGKNRLEMGGRILPPPPYT